MQQLHQAAIHDLLTGLANRAGLREYIDTLVPGTDIGVIAPGPRPLQVRQ
ncbi:MAG: hypothetical protein R2789_13475 [Microthrixaceae bacterium]